MPEATAAGSVTSRRAFLGALASTGAAVTAVGVTAGADGAGSHTVAMRSNPFDPVGLHVEPGATVRFDLAEGSHSATAYPARIPEGATAFNTGVIAEGAVEVTLDVPGTYDYYCIPHEGMGMVGRIVVGTPGGPAGDEPVGTDAVPAPERIVDAGAVASDVFDGSGSAGCPGMGGGSDGGMGGGSDGGMGGGHGGRREAHSCHSGSASGSSGRSVPWPTCSRVATPVARTRRWRPSTGDSRWARSTRRPTTGGGRSSPTTGSESPDRRVGAVRAGQPRPPA